MRPVSYEIANLEINRTHYSLFNHMTIFFSKTAGNVNDTKGIEYIAEDEFIERQNFKIELTHNLFPLVLNFLFLLLAFHLFHLFHEQHNNESIHIQLDQHIFVMQQQHHLLDQ